MKILCFPEGPFESNMYAVCSGEDIVFIDPSVSYSRVSELFSFDISKVRGVLITHGHCDHILFAEQWQAKLPDVPFYMNPKDCDIAKSATANYSYEMGDSKSFDIDTIDVREVKEIGNLELTTIETPGHTVGSCVYILKDRLEGDIAAFSGDTVFRGSVGRTDLFSGSFASIIESIELIKKLDDSLALYPGHGSKTTIGFEKANNPFFR